MEGLLSPKNIGMGLALTPKPLAVDREQQFWCISHFPFPTPFLSFILFYFILFYYYFGQGFPSISI